MKKFYIILAILLCVSFELLAKEESRTLPLSKGRGVFYFELDTDYYYTENNYIKFFKVQPLPVVDSESVVISKGSFFRYMSNRFSAGYSFLNWLELELFLRGIWFAQSSDGLNSRFGSFYTYRGGAVLRSQQRFGEGSLGGGLIQEFSTSHPFGGMNSSSFSKPFTDDRAYHFTPALWVYGSLWNVFYPFIYTGLNIRTKGLSNLLQMRLGLQFQTGMVEIGAYGYSFLSITEDSDSFGDRKGLIQANAGSLKFGSYNPTVIGFFTWLGWNFPYISFRLSGDMDINGTQYAKGYAFSLSVLFHFGGGAGDMENIFQKDQEESFKPESTLNKEDTEDIFKTPEDVFNKAMFLEHSPAVEKAEL